MNETRRGESVVKRGKEKIQEKRGKERVKQNKRRRELIKGGKERM